MPADAVQEHGALFDRRGEMFVPTPLARGPWDPNALHGGAPSALFAFVLGRHDPGPASFVARLTVELMRPVPLAPLQVVARTIRPGKKVQWLEGAVLADGREVARATALRMRVDEVDVHDQVSPEVPPVPPRVELMEATPTMSSQVGFWSAHEIMRATGQFGMAGPAQTWFRLKVPVVGGETLAPVERVAAAADFGSGVGNPLPFTNARAINPELTIHLHREPAGEWVCLDSGGWMESHGVGMVETRIYDDNGAIGRGVQAMLVESLPVPWTH